MYKALMIEDHKEVRDFVKEYFDHKEANKRSFYPGCQKIDAKTIRFETTCFYEVLRALLFL